MGRKLLQRGSVTELRGRIVSRASSDAGDVQIAQAIDISALHTLDRTVFNDIIDQGCFKRRTAYYLLKVGQLIETGVVTRSDAEKVGWSKLQVIADGLTSRNAGRRVRLALDNSVQELKRKLHRNGDEAAKHCVLMYFTDAQYEVFRDALRRHGAKPSRRRGLIGKEEALLKALKLGARAKASRSAKRPNRPGTG